MDSLIILLIIWFVIDILGGNKKKQDERKRLEGRKSMDELRRTAEETDSWLERQAIKDEIQQRELEDMQQHQRAERGVAASKRNIQQPTRTGKTIIFGDWGDFIREFRDLMDVDSLPEVRPRTQAEIMAEKEAQILAEMQSQTQDDVSSEASGRHNRRLTRGQTANTGRSRNNGRYQNDAAYDYPEEWYEYAEDSLDAEPAGRECGYCTGETAVESTINTRTAAAKPVVLIDRPKRDVAAACRELQLNEMQQAVVWSEILDKPLALRRRGR